MSKFIPLRTPSSTTNSVGEWFSTMSTRSSSASSSSQGEALKYGFDLRAITLTFVPPIRFEVRQQSMAVFPTPMTSTFSSMEFVCPKATDSSQSMPIWMWSVSYRPGRRSSLPRGAPEPTKTASKSCSSSHFMLSTGAL